MQSIERLVVYGGSQAVAVNLEGGGGDDEVYGGGGDDFIVTGGGADLLQGGGGADYLEGGVGNDTYILDNTGDTVKELAGEGNDRIITSVSYALPDNVESIQLVGKGDTSATGNALANYLGGNGGANVLDGREGADQMLGGTGNDTYFVDNAGDVVTEGLNAGRDRVISSIGTTLTANVESLQLVGNDATAATGNALANYLGGNSRANAFDGRGGADQMFGGSGNDTFTFRAGEAKGDLVGDFSGAHRAGGDVLVFSGYGKGATLTEVGTSDSYTVHSGDGTIAETIRIANVTGPLNGDDVIFV